VLERLKEWTVLYLRTVPLEVIYCAANRLFAREFCPHWYHRRHLATQMGGGGEEAFSSGLPYY